MGRTPRARESKTGPRIEKMEASPRGCPEYPGQEGAIPDCSGAKALLHSGAQWCSIPHKVTVSHIKRLMANSPSGVLDSARELMQLSQAMSTSPGQGFCRLPGEEACAPGASVLP